jgi:aquaporin Z
MIGKDFSAVPAIGINNGGGAAFLGETVITFALCLVVLLTATSKAQANNSYYGLAIGSTVLSGAISVGPISGGAFNPAVGTMTLLYDSGVREDIWCYWCGPLLGAILAGAFFRVVCREEYTGEKVNDLMETVSAGLMEFTGTFMLCFTVATAASALNTSQLVPLGIGSMLMVMVYAGGSVSGGHYNPAVTLGVYIRSLFGATHDRFTIIHAVVYFFSQVFGAMLATYTAWGVLEGNKTMGFPVLPSNGKIGKGFLGELLGTFLLVYVVLNVATSKQLHGNSFFGLAIGQTVTCMAIALGPITGGAFNPAVGLIGPMSGGKKPGADLDEVWIYWVACPIGAVLAAVMFRAQNYEEFGTNLVTQKFMAHVSADAEGDHFQRHASRRGKAVKQATEAEAEASVVPPKI